MIFSASLPKKVSAQSNIKPCPACSKSGKSVNDVTIKAQLKKECRNSMATQEDSFNFCTNPECKTVYYSKTNEESFFEEDIKTKVTIKNDDPATPLCYCHKYKKADALDDIKMLAPGDVLKKIKEIISRDKSFCQKANPKGSCCTEDIKSFLASHNIPWEKSFKLTPSPALSLKETCC